MAKNKTDDAKDAGKDGAKDKPATKRVELIDQGDPASSGLPGYIGLGLIGGFIVGFGPLRDAVQGVGPFEDAMVRFLACILVCVVGASILGRILESAPAAETDAAATGAAGAAGADGDSIGSVGEAGDGDPAS